MNILLIYPAKLDKNGRPVKYRKAFLPPLSLAILNSLTPAKHEVKVINDIVEDVDFSISYDLVGITAMTSQAERAYQIADRFRELGTKVVIGGIHASVL
ncbi:MAG: B12-binding domain-containing radical SAM protein, partial [Desulfobacteria bacterium]